jgi:hypothetical protein
MGSADREKEKGFDAFSQNPKMQIRIWPVNPIRARPGPHNPTLPTALTADGDYRSEEKRVS